MDCGCYSRLGLARACTNNNVGTVGVKCLASLIVVARPLTAFLSQLVKSGAYIRHIDAFSVVIVIAHAYLNKVVAGIDTLLAFGDLDTGTWSSANLLLAISVYGVLVVPRIEGVSDNTAPATAAVDRSLLVLVSVFVSFLLSVFKLDVIRRIGSA